MRARTRRSDGRRSRLKGEDLVESIIPFTLVNVDVMTSLGSWFASVCKNCIIVGGSIGLMDTSIKRGATRNKVWGVRSVNYTRNTFSNPEV